MVLICIDNIMKHVIVIAVMVSLVGIAACSDDPDVPRLPLLQSDSLALVEISKALGTDDADYPVRWTPADRTTWTEIELDTITDKATGMRYLAVSSLTVYLMREGQITPFYISKLLNLNELRIYGCNGALIAPDWLSPSIESLLIDRLNPDDKGYMEIANGSGVFYFHSRSPLSSVTIHGLRMKSTSFVFATSGSIDLSDNTLEGEVSTNFRLCPRVNLSHNNFSALWKGWDKWCVEDGYVPDLQYNDIEIPEDILNTDFWRDNHEKFIGNPGYHAVSE